MGMIVIIWLVAIFAGLLWLESSRKFDRRLTGENFQATAPDESCVAEPSVVDPRPQVVPPKALAIARHLVLVGATMQINPFWRISASQGLEWGALAFLCVTLFSVVATALLSLLFTKSQGTALASNFTKLLWVTALLALLGTWQDFQGATVPAAERALSQSEFDPSTAVLVEPVAKP